LGLIVFYHQFIPNAATTLQSLNELLATVKNSEVFRWVKPTMSAFHIIKDELVNASLLIHSKPEVPTSMMGDTLEVVLGMVLHQFIDADLH